MRNFGLNPLVNLTFDPIDATASQWNRLGELTSAYEPIDGGPGQAC